MNDLIIFSKEELRKLIKECFDQKAEELQVKQDKTPEDQWLNVEKAAEFLDLAVPTIYTLNSKGKIPCHKTGKKLYFKRSELKLWLESNGKMSVYKSRKARLKRKGGKQ